jgi:hypothetical protein
VLDPTAKLSDAKFANTSFIAVICYTSILAAKTLGLNSISESQRCHVLYLQFLRPFPINSFLYIPHQSPLITLVASDYSRYDQKSFFILL